MTKESLAKQLDCRERGDEIDDDESAEAGRSGLLVLFGYSDDNVEVRGLSEDEIPAFEGTTLYVHAGGILGYHDDGCDCCYCGHKAAKSKCAQVKAVFDGGKGYAWHFETALPHATFNICEGEENFCLGIVLDSKDLPTI
jgi:hypothetical protein